MNFLYEKLDSIVFNKKFTKNDVCIKNKKT